MKKAAVIEAGARCSGGEGWLGEGEGEGGGGGGGSAGGDAWQRWAEEVCVCKDEKCNEKMA